MTLAPGAFAEVLDVPAAQATYQAPAPSGYGGTLPARGASMATVEQQFGAPRQKHAPAGGDSAAHPPITRWDYEGFSVFFEHSHVIDSVVPGAPPAVENRDELRTGT